MTEARGWTGAALVVLAAVTLSSTSVSAVLSYGGGANPSAVMFIRILGSITVLFGLLRISGVRIRLSRRDLAFALVLGLPQAAQSYFLYTSLGLIPVGLTLIAFYTYPLMIGALASAIGQDRLTWTLAGGLAVAFAGLVLVFNVSVKGFGYAGLIYAVLAALSWSVVVVGTASRTRGRDSRPFTFHVQVTALFFVVVFLAATRDVRFPHTAAAWAGYAFIPLLYGIGITSFFIANAIIGSVRASFIMNFEPVAGIVLGYLVLGQTLTPLQLLGGAIVISALVGVGWNARRRAAARSGVGP